MLNTTIQVKSKGNINTNDTHFTKSVFKEVLSFVNKLTEKLAVVNKGGSLEHNGFPLFTCWMPFNWYVAKLSEQALIMRIPTSTFHIGINIRNNFSCYNLCDNWTTWTWFCSLTSCYLTGAGNAKKETRYLRLQVCRVELYIAWNIFQQLRPFGTRTAIISTAVCSVKLVVLIPYVVAFL